MQAPGHVGGFEANGAGLLGIALLRERRGQQREVESAPAHVGGVHVERAAGVVGCWSAVAKIAEALRDTGGQVCLIEIAQPCWLVPGSRLVERALCCREGLGARAGVVACRMAVCLGHIALGDKDREPRPVRCGAGYAGEVDRLIGLGNIDSLLAHRGKDFRTESVIAGQPGQPERLDQVALSEAVGFGVVGHPAHELR